MECVTCGCDLSQDETDEVTEVYGVDYAGQCMDCACDTWHDHNLAPIDEDDDE